MGNTEPGAKLHETPEGTEIRSPGVAHEASDVNARAVLGFMAGLTAMIAVVYLLLWGMFDWFETRANKSEPVPNSRLSAGVQRLPAEPRLQLAPGHESHPLEDLQKLREEENKRLENYGWVDQQRGIVSIPIDQAKKLLIERSRATQSQQREWPAEAMPSSSSSGRMPERRNQ